MSFNYKKNDKKIDKNKIFLFKMLLITIYTI